MPAKTDADFIEDAYGDELKLLYANLVAAIAEATGGTARNEADDRFARGLLLARNAREAAFAQLLKLG